MWGRMPRLACGRCCQESPASLRLAPSWSTMPGHSSGKASKLCFFLRWNEIGHSHERVLGERLVDSKFAPASGRQEGRFDIPHPHTARYLSLRSS